MKFFETPEFSAGGDKWTMCFYPNGNEARGGTGFVSLYLRRQKTPGSRSKEASVAMKFFVLEQNSDEYLVIEDLGEKQFDIRGKEWGIPQILEINYFNESDNGFVVDNTCTFGAEIFITSSEPSFSKTSLVKTISKRLFELSITLDSSATDNIDSIPFVTKFDGETYTC
ncbi:uncharacterized protein [Spinacia oleracea]|uniref:MATH domain-containing protein n=1 Tax=Spinacia oleracea TaxID=3562 RepID=A0A9R0I0K5_SPIOL|nr:uncharacterized protein LOC110780352 [Spinacia oleracea]